MRHSELVCSDERRPEQPARLYDDGGEAYLAILVRMHAREAQRRLARARAAASMSSALRLALEQGARGIG